MTKIVFYETSSGRCPVADFLEGLPEKQHAKAVRSLQLLEEFGLSLPRGYISHIKGKIWELRIHCGHDISRIFYFIPIRSTFVLLHGFIKKTQKTPGTDIEIAQNRMKSYMRKLKSHADTTRPH